MLTPDELEAADAAPARGAPVPDKMPAHRHSFDDAGICTKCGKVKSANGRKPNAAPVAELSGLPTDTRTLQLPAAKLVGDAAADRFADGGQGSSMVRR